MKTNQTSFGDALARSFKLSLQMTVLVGPFFLLWGVWLDYSTARFVEASDRIEAQVSAIDTIQRDGETFYRPTFSFRISSGEVKQYRGTVWVRPNPYRADDIELGWHHPETGVFKGDAMIEQDRQASSVFVTLGAIACLISVLFVILPRVRRFIRP